MLIFSGKHKNQNDEYIAFTFLICLETISLVLGTLFNKRSATHYETLFIIDKRRLWGHLTAAFQYLNGGYREDGEGLFITACRDRTRGKF